MKSHEKLPRQFPHIIKVANVVVKIYRGKTRGYDLFTVIHYRDGKRERKVFARFAEARSHAQEVATQIARGRVNVLSLTSADRDSYVAAMNLLQPSAFHCMSWSRNTRRRDRIFRMNRS